jgi:hypothetical protein
LPSIRTPRDRNRGRLITPDWAMKFRRLCALADELADERCGGLFCKRVDCPGCEHRNLRFEIVLHYDVPTWCVGLSDDWEVDEAGLSAAEVQAKWAATLADALERASVSYVEALR